MFRHILDWNKLNNILKLYINEGEWYRDGENDYLQPLENMYSWRGMTKHLTFCRGFNGQFFPDTTKKAFVVHGAWYHTNTLCTMIRIQDSSMMNGFSSPFLFVFVLFSFFFVFCCLCSCIQCSLCLWIIHSLLPLRILLTFIEGNDVRLIRPISYNCQNLGFL